jgi:hypothetical protein
LPENACGPFFHEQDSRGANRPEPHHYAKKQAQGQWANEAGVYSWITRCRIYDDKESFRTLKRAKHEEKKIGRTVNSFPQEEGFLDEASASVSERRVDRDALERINAAASELNLEAEDILKYQSLDDPSANRVNLPRQPRRKRQN